MKCSELAEGVYRHVPQDLVVRPATNVNSVYNTDLCKKKHKKKELVNRANHIPGGQEPVEHLVNLPKQ
jgi:hypothetical protein